jgi:hypothetical protein
MIKRVDGQTEKEDERTNERSLVWRWNMPVRQRQKVEGELSTEEGNHFLFSTNQAQDLRGNSQHLLLQSNLLAVAVAQVEDLLNRRILSLCLLNVCCSVKADPALGKWWCALSCCRRHVL